MSKKLTPWFPGDVKPAYPGMYETNAEQGRLGGRSFQRWNGTSWGYCTASLDFDMACVSRYQSPKWRGLAKKPATKDAEVSNG